MADRTNDQNHNYLIFRTFSIGQFVSVADRPDNLAVRSARAGDARGLSAGRAATIRKSRMVPTIRWHRTVQPLGIKEVSLGNCRAALLDHREGPANATAHATELLAMTMPDKSSRSRQRYQTILADENMLGCRFQLIPAMNPATVAGIGLFIGPRFEGKLSLSQVESTARSRAPLRRTQLSKIFG